VSSTDAPQNSIPFFDTTAMAKYSETLTDHVMLPCNGGAIGHPGLTGDAGAPVPRRVCMTLDLKVQADSITASERRALNDPDT
jgi:hypothetical protein